MIIVKIWGGLGNQMFQYAMGLALSLRSGSDLRLDISHFDKSSLNETARPFKLELFPGIVPLYASAEDIKLCLPTIESPVLRAIYKKANTLFPKLNRHYQLESQGKWPAIKGQATYFEGYWQSEKHFKDYRDKILDCFDLTYAEGTEDLNKFKEEINEVESVSIHVRRGDYVTNTKANAYHGVCSVEYYQDSIKRIANQFRQKDLKFFVFSDDIEWCQENLHIDFTHQYMTTKRDYHDLYLMSSCKHNIIANSSFSWWGAWLNRNVDKMVIAPKKWFVNHDSEDRLPQSWVKL